MVGKGVKALIATIVVVVVHWISAEGSVQHNGRTHERDDKERMSLQHGGRNGIPTLWKCPVPAGGGE